MNSAENEARTASFVTDSPFCLRSLRASRSNSAGVIPPATATCPSPIPALIRVIIRAPAIREKNLGIYIFGHMTPGAGFRYSRCMCGIAGLLLPSPEHVDGKLLRSLSDDLEHRGPDDAGFLILHDKHLALRREVGDDRKTDNTHSAVNGDDDFRHRGHADHIRTDRPQETILGARFQIRSRHGRPRMPSNLQPIIVPGEYLPGAVTVSRRMSSPPSRYTDRISRRNDRSSGVSRGSQSRWANCGCSSRLSSKR